jgi:septum formation protein
MHDNTVAWLPPCQPAYPSSAERMIHSLAQHPLILASASPRRRDLLTEAGYDFEIHAAHVDEVHDEAAPLHVLTMENAAAKARCIAARFPARLIVAADTLVCVDGRALTKPADMTEARAMIDSLAGRTHEVCTSVVLRCEAEEIEHRFEAVTRVTFKPLTPAERDAYLALIEPLDKAGGYAAQEHGDLIIAAVEGSWTNVVGLPMEALAEHLSALGVHPRGGPK